MTKNLTLRPLSLNQEHREGSWENSLLAAVSSLKILLALFFVTLFLTEAEFLSHVRVSAASFIKKNKNLGLSL